MGIHHSDSPIPAFIYMDHMRSLKVYKNSTFLKMAEEVPRILEEVVQGIDYLHSKKLVHMELNSNTITVWCYFANFTRYWLPIISCYDFNTLRI